MAGKNKAEPSAFNRYFERLSEVYHDVTYENFVALQKFKADILNSYTAGGLSDFEKRTLYNAAAIIMGNMRKEFALQKGENDGTEKNQNGTARSLDR